MAEVATEETLDNLICSRGKLYYQQNLALVQQRDARLAKALEACVVEEEDIRAELSKDGNANLILQGKPLYSRYRPHEESQRWVKKELREECNAAIFAGFGLAYQIEVFRQERSKGVIILVENNLALFKAALMLRDLSALLSDPYLFWSVGEKASADGLLYRYSDRKFQFFQMQALYNLEDQFYKNLQKRVLSLLNRFRINNNTLNRFGKLWVKNIAMNLPYLQKSSDAGIFFKKFSKFPFLLLAAGPSLEIVLPYLKEFQKRMVIVAVDTALGVMLKHGVSPDFVVSVDPQLLNARHYDHAESPRSILISESCVYPLIFRKAWRHTAIFHSSFPLMEGFQEKMGGLSKVRSGGSVATAAWDFIRNCRANSLYIAGLDLSYPSFRSHCRGTLSQRYGLYKSGRLAPIEHTNWRVTVSAGAQRIPAQDGSTVLSDKRMAVYRNWLEENLSHNPKWPNYNISHPHSAKIKGLCSTDIAKVLDLPQIRAEIDCHISDILREVEQKQDEGLGAAFRQHLAKQVQDVHDLYHWSGELLALFCYSRLKPSQEQRIQELQAKVLVSPVRSILSFFFTESLSKVVGRSPEQENAELLAQDRMQIYQQFYISSKYHLYWLQQALERFPAS